MFVKTLPLILAAVMTLSACEGSEQRAARHFDSGVALLDAGEVSQALLEFRNVLRLQDDHAEARTLLARTLRERGETGSAFREYSRLIERHPDIVEGRIALAEMAFEAGNWDEAARHGQAAQKLAPTDPLVTLLRAALDYREAVLAGDSAAIQEGVAPARAYLQDVDGRNLIAWRLVVDQSLSRGDRETTLTELDAALSARPDIYDFHGLRLQLLAELDRDAEITTALQTMITQFPDREEPRALLVSWYLNQGDVDAAEAFLREMADSPEADVAEKLVFVEFLRQTRGDAAAMEEIDRLISIETETREDLDTYRALRASMQFERGETEGAMADMEQLLDDAEISERTDDLRIILARMRLATGNPVGARALVEQVLERDSSHVEALKMRARWLIEGDRPTEAIAALRTAQAAAPRDPQLMVLMGQAHEREGAPELAGERYALAVELSGQAVRESLLYARHLLEAGRLDSADATLASAMRVSPQSLELMHAMAEVQMRRNDWDRVTRLIWQMRGLDTAAAHASANEVEAALLLRQGRTDDTIAFLESLVGQGAGIGAVAQLARAQVMQGQNDGARDLIDTQLVENPDNPVLRFVRAGLHLLEDEAAEAEAIYRTLVAEYPGAEPPLRVLYSLLQTQGRTEEAEGIIDAAIEAAPGAPMPLVLRAAQLERTGDIDGAIAIYEDLYAADSSNLILANNLASLISAHRDDAESLDRATAIASRLRGTTVPAFQDTFGWIQYRRGNYEEALEYLEPAAAGLPDDSLVQYHLGMTYLALDRPTEARDTLERALEIAGDDNPLPQFQRAREELQALVGQ
jgi:cellulose synthase operon protein C